MWRNGILFALCAAAIVAGCAVQEDGGRRFDLGVATNTALCLAPMLPAVQSVIQAPEDQRLARSAEAITLLATHVVTDPTCQAAVNGMTAPPARPVTS